MPFSEYIVPANPHYLISPKTSSLLLCLPSPSFSHFILPSFISVSQFKKMSSENLFTEQQIASTQAKIDARKRFESVFPLLVEELTSHLQSINLPQNAIEWFKNVSPSMDIVNKKNLNYNTPGGKLNRGLSVVDTYQILVGKPLSDEIHMKVSILGWAVELVLSLPSSPDGDSYKHTFLLRMI